MPCFTPNPCSVGFCKLPSTGMSALHSDGGMFIVSELKIISFEIFFLFFLLPLSPGTITFTSVQPVDTHLWFLRTFRLLSICSLLQSCYFLQKQNTEHSCTFTGATQAVMSVRITNVLLSINAIFCYWENVWQWKEKYFTSSKVLCLVSGKCGCKAGCLWSLRQQVHFSVSDRLMHVQHQLLLPAFSWIPAVFNPAIQSIYIFLFLSRRPLRKDASALSHGAVLPFVCSSFSSVTSFFL